MKKVFALFLILSLAFCILPALAESETNETEYIDGIYRFIVRDDNTAELIGIIAPNEKTIKVPDSLTTKEIISGKSYKQIKKEDWKEYDLTAIRSSAFSYHRNIKKLTLPDSVTYIEAYSFSGCENLTDIRLPKGLTSIEDYLLAYCYNLQAITIPENVTSIGDSAFESCEKLRTVNIPNSVTTIGKRAFIFCNSLTKIRLPADLTAIGDFAFAECKGITAFNIPDKVVRIGNNAFSHCDSASSIVIPDSVTSIGDYAFQYCESLTGMMLPDSVTEIGANPFLRCEKLAEVHISADHPALEYRDGALISKADHRLVYYSPSRENSAYVIPKGIEIIGDNAFAYCYNLFSIRFPDSLTRIGNEAFYSCPLSGTIPEDVGNPDEKDESFYKKLTEFRLPENLESIGNAAFYTCFKMDESTISIIIPDSLCEIGENPFENCKNVSFVISPDHPFMGTIDGDLITKRDKTLICHLVREGETECITSQEIERIGDRAFAGNHNLTRIELSEGIREIGRMAFDSCSNITSVILPDSLKVIGEGAFWYCALKEITLPAGLESIGYNLFFGNPDITVNVYPDSYAAKYYEENFFDLTLRVLEP